MRWKECKPMNNSELDRLMAYAPMPQFALAVPVVQYAQTLTGNVNIADPGNAVPLGGEVEYRFTQDGAGAHTVTFDAVFKGASAVGATAGKWSVYRFRKISVTQYVLLFQNLNVTI